MLRMFPNINLLPHARAFPPYPADTPRGRYLFSQPDGRTKATQLKSREFKGRVRYPLVSP